MSNDQNSTRTMDDAQPTSDKAPAPIALLVIFAALVYWGMLYLDDHGGGFDPVVYMPYANYADVNDHQIVLDPKLVAMREGEKVFNANCAVCHGATGLGGPVCPPLAGSDWVNAVGPDRIARLVLNGGAGPITVANKNYTPTGSMLSFKDKKDQEIAWALTYVRNSWGNSASMVKPEDIKMIREQVASRRTPWTAPELLNIEFKVQMAEKK